MNWKNEIFTLLSDPDIAIKLNAISEKIKNSLPDNLGRDTAELLKDFNTESKILLEEVIQEIQKAKESGKTIQEAAEEVMKNIFAPAQDDNKSSKNEPEKIELSWDDISKDIKIVSSQIMEDHPEIDTILCITRGGLIPAGMISYTTGIKNIINIKVESYEEFEQKELKLKNLSKKDIRTLDKAKGILIVDDIIDTGKTIIAVYDYLGKLGYELEIDNALLEKSQVFSIVTKDPEEDDYYLYDMADDERWVVFPWDK